MKLNKVEFIAMNNPVRRFLQRYNEFKVFHDYIKKNNLIFLKKSILDAGCGSGYSSKIIYKNLYPQTLRAFDFMPKQIELAKKKNPYADYYVGDITDIKEEDESFDAIFVFGILHHVPNWKQALSEIFRVLKRDGHLFIFEVNDRGVHFVDTYLNFHHPKEASFNWCEFKAALIDENFIIEEEKKVTIDYFHAFICKKNNLK